MAPIRRPGVRVAGGQPQRGQGWSEELLKAALDRVDPNSRNPLSVREAAKRYGIPRRTLRNHIKSGSQTKRFGRKGLLGPDVENELVARIKRFAAVGLPLTGKIIRSYVHEYVEKNNIAHPFTSSKAGEKWFQLFKIRHPDISVRKAQNMNAARAQKLNREIVKDHFEKIGGKNGRDEHF